MTTKMTERDKKLLAGLGAFCVAALFVMLVFMPLYTANQMMKEQIEENEMRIAQMEEKEAGLLAVREENVARQEALEQAQQDLYPMLKSQEIDRLLTERTAANGLSARKLQITMPEEAASVTGYGRENDDGSNPDKKDGVWIAKVSLEVTGTMTSMDHFIDNLARDLPGVRITGISWSSDRRQVDTRTGLTEQYNIMSLQLDVLMGRKG